jgi:hypothetical protein
MTPITSLVPPILVAAVAVFVLSLIVQMELPWHKRDFDNVPDDDAVLNAIRRSSRNGRRGDRGMDHRHDREARR